MATTNLGLDDTLSNLTEGQEQKEIAINSNTTKLLANIATLDTSIPTFLGQSASAPSSGTWPLGSTYYNTTDDTTYVLVAKSSDVWKAVGSIWGSVEGTLSDQTDLQSALDGKATSAQGALADSAPRYLGSNASAPADPAGPIGSRYYNTGDSKFYTLTAVGTDVWTAES